MRSRAAPQPRPKGGQITSLKDLAKAVAPAPDTEPVDPAKAFRIDVTSASDTLLARFMMDDCCYLYRDKIHFTLTRRDGSKTDIQIGNVSPPKRAARSTSFGKTEVCYPNVVEVRLPVKAAAQIVRAELQPQSGLPRLLEKGRDHLLSAGDRKSHRAPRRDGKVLVTGPAVPATARRRKPKRNIKTSCWPWWRPSAPDCCSPSPPCVLPMIPILERNRGSAARHITTARVADCCRSPMYWARR